MGHRPAHGPALRADGRAGRGRSPVPGTGGADPGEAVRELPRRRLAQREAGADDGQGAAAPGATAGRRSCRGRPRRACCWRWSRATPPEMPQKGEPLSAEEVASLRAWIERGAPWPDGVTLKDRKFEGETWWAFRPLVRPRVPEVKAEGWARTPVDAFILQGLERKGLAPGPEADRRTLIRRLTYRPARPAPDPRGDRRLPRRHRPGRLREAGRPPARLAPLRRALGAALARRRPLRRHPRLRQGQAARPTPGPTATTSSGRFNDDKPYARFVREQVAGDVLVPGRPRRRDRHRLHRRRPVGLRRPRRAARGDGRQGRRPACSTATTWWPTRSRRSRA